MELHFTHASRRLTKRAAPLEVQKLVITGGQPALTKLFADRYALLTKRGELSNLPGRLVDRRPVEVKPARMEWQPPAKVQSGATKRAAYDGAYIPGLRTATTLGKPVDMTNRKAEEQGGRPARVAGQAKEEGGG